MVWKLVDEKYFPTNPDGSDHDCRRKAARRKAWLKVHAPALRNNAMLNRQFKQTLEQGKK